MRERQPLGVGLLEDQDYYCYHHCLIFPSFTPSPILLVSSTFFPSLISPSCLSPPSLPSPLFSLSSFSLLFLSILALRVRTGC